MTPDSGYGWVDIKWLFLQRQAYGGSWTDEQWEKAINELDQKRGRTPAFRFDSNGRKMPILK